MDQDKQGQGPQQPSKLEAAAQSFKWAFKDSRSNGLAEVLKEIAYAPSYIPSKDMSLEDVAFLEGRRHLAMTILKSATLL